MTISTEILKERLREAFGTESQETIGKKINLAQGTVSKILSGAQLPATDTLFTIAEVYNVSIDWLMGLSDKKSVTKSDGDFSYALTTEVLINLVFKGAKYSQENRNISIEIDDPILKRLMKKSLTLINTDKDLYQKWKETKLSLFDDKDLIHAMIFKDEDMDYCVAEAKTDEDFLGVCDAAKTKQEFYDEIYLDD